MKKVLYIIIYALLLPLLVTIYGCSPKEEKATVDSRFNASYIANIGITEPEKALALIDTAEQKEYYLNGNYPQSMQFCTEGIKLAQDSLIKNSEAKLTFNLGRNLLVLNREDEGFRYYRKAVDILDEESKKDDTWRTADDYIYTLAIWIGTLRNEEHFEEAIALLPRYEEAVSRLETKKQMPDGLLAYAPGKRLCAGQAAMRLLPIFMP